MKKSITLRLQIYMYSFGIMMGIIFPFYASLFDSWKSLWFKGGALAAGIMVGFFCYTMVKVVLLRELRKINTFAESLRNNDLTAEIAIESADTVGQIVTSLSHSTDSIRTLVTQMKRTSETIFTSLHELRRFSESMNSSSDEIRDQTGAVSAGSELIRRNSAEISSEAEAAADAADKIAADIKELSSSVESIHQKCSLEAALTCEVQTLFGDTQSAVSDLSLRSAKIEKIVSVIEDIADRTNLLAINAHVEAANAGIHGKSFAVVASEVRTLAEQSRKSAAEIELLIKEIFPAVERSQNSISVSAERIAALSELAEEIAAETARETGILRNIDGELSRSGESMRKMAKNIIQNDAEIGSSTSKLKMISAEAVQIREEIHESAQTIFQLEQESAELAEISRRFRIA